MKNINRYEQRNLNQWKHSFHLENINKTKQLFISILVTKIKRRDKLPIPIKWKAITDLIDVIGIIREYCQQLCCNDLINSDEMKKFPK